jgi:hypothetical protein
VQANTYEDKRYHMTNKKQINIYMKKVVLSFLLVALSATAQVQKIKNLQITEGAAIGKVLTSSGTGVETWQGVATWQNIPGTGAGSGTTVAVTVVSPIHSATGRVWMDRNLGASRKAQAYNDYMAYGQLYQWGRGNDGHADINWTSATTGTSVNGTTPTLSTTDYPANNLFITTSTSPYDWRATQNNNLWQGDTGINNPCPIDYRLPTSAEWTAEVTSYNITNRATAFDSALRLVTAGYRAGPNGNVSSNNTGYYMSSTVNGSMSSVRYFNATTASVDSNRVTAYSVRCIKN